MNNELLYKVFFEGILQGAWSNFKKKISNQFKNLSGNNKKFPKIIKGRKPTDVILKELIELPKQINFRRNHLLITCVRVLNTE